MSRQLSSLFVGPTRLERSPSAGSPAPDGGCAAAPVRHVRLIPLLLGVFGCASDRTPVGQAPGCLVGGTPREEMLFMTAAELDAVVRVELTAISGDITTVATCSGVLIAPEWVLTARHCAPLPDRTSVRVDFGTAMVLPLGADGSGGAACGVRIGPALSIAASALVPHLDRDLLLLRLESTPAARGLHVVPARFGAADGLRAGQPVLLAGFGRNPDVLGGTRQFLAEPIFAVDADIVTVDGSGDSGACAGDSGGPLLLRDPSGAIAALGILSAGSTDCLHADAYVRLAPAFDWLSAAVGVPPDATETRPCGDMPGEGRCYGDTAVWCDSGALRAEPCSTESPCGWNRSAQGYRCVTAADDPCQGISSFGWCDGEIATRCEAGALRRERCTAGCRRSPTTGTIACASCLSREHQEEVR